MPMITSLTIEMIMCNKIKLWLSLCVLFSFIGLSVFAADQNELSIYKLNHQKAKSIISMIKPHASKDTIITGKNYQLFIDAPPAEQKRLKTIIEALDQALEQYQVEVKILDKPMPNHDTNSTTRASKIKTYRVLASNANQNSFSVRVLENSPAFVSTGEEFPNNQIQSQYGHLLPSTGRTKIRSGFYIIVIKQPNERVQLIVSAQQQQASIYQKNINNSVASSKISGDKEQWILIASTAREAEINSNKRYTTGSKTNKQRWYYVRVSSL
jgi:hypothetical protein